MARRGQRRRFGDDGGLATAARFHGLDGVAIDANGNLYLTDQVNWRIWKAIGIATPSLVAGR